MLASDMAPLAVVTGASSGIGLELARCCAQSGYDLVIAADSPDIHNAAAMLRLLGVAVASVQADLATPGGVDELIAELKDRPVAALMANAGHGLGGAFLDQQLDAVQHVVDTNISGTLRLLHHVCNTMRTNGSGRVLITGSVVGFIPGPFAAVYTASKAFIDSFAVALRNELQDSGVTVTCLMPGPTATGFFARAGMLDTRLGASGDKSDPAEVARAGFEAMLAGEAEVVAGLMNKLQVAVAKIAPSQFAARQYRKSAMPGSSQGNAGSAKKKSRA